MQATTVLLRPLWDVDYFCDSCALWFGRTIVAFVFWKLECHLKLTWRLILREESFRSISALGIWALCLKCLLFLTIGTYLPLPGGKPTAIGCMFWQFLRQLWPTTQKHSCLVLGFLLDELLLLEKALLVQIGKLYSNYLCIFISGLTSIIGSFSWTINCVILDFFSDILIVLLPLFLCIYLSLPLRVPPPFSFSPSDHSCPAVVPHSIVPPLPYPGRSAVYFSGHSSYSRLCTHILSLELAASDEREY